MTAAISDSFNRPACTFPGCKRPLVARGSCAGHYAQGRRGQPLRPIGKRGIPHAKRAYRDKSPPIQKPLIGMPRMSEDYTPIYRVADLTTPPAKLAAPPNPIPASPGAYRAVTCPAANYCLDLALKRGWTSYGCGACENRSGERERGRESLLRIATDRKPT